MLANTDLAATAVPLIAVLWDDLLLNPSGTQQVYWKLVGSGDDQQLIVQWNKLDYYEAPADNFRLRFQAILSERDNSIQINYAEINDANYPSGSGGKEATVGIRGENASEVLLISYNGSTTVNPNWAQYVATGKSLRIVSATTGASIDFADFRVLDAGLDLAVAAGTPVSITATIRDKNAADGSNFNASWQVRNGDNVTVASGGPTTLSFQTQNGVPTATLPIAFTPSVQGLYTVSITANDVNASATHTDTVYVRAEDRTATPELADATFQETSDGWIDYTYIVRLSKPISQSLTVPISLISATALSDEDFFFRARIGDDYITNLTFPAGVTEVPITLEIWGDALDEPDERFTLQVGGERADIFIQDDDELPTISVADAAASEGANASFVVTLSQAYDDDVTFAAILSGLTATAGVDFNAAAVNVTIPAGAITRTISIPILGDTRHELSETFHLTLTNVQNATVLDGEAEGTINDDDPEPTLTTGNLTVTEGSAAVFTVSLSAASGLPVTVNYATMLGSAGADDFTPVAGSLTFAPGQTTQTITIATSDDSIHEATENFRVLLSAATAAALGISLATATLVDNDPVPALRITDATVAEGDGFVTGAVLTITLDRPSVDPITVALASGGGTATAVLDYLAVFGTLRFAPGETSKTIDVTILADIIDEFDESFFVTLSAPTNATIGDGSGTVAITDNDDVPVLTIAETEVVEGDSGVVQAVLRLSLSSESGKAVTVDFQTENDTAHAGMDYVARSGTVTFQPGQTTQTIVVDVTGDTLHEAVEQFRVRLANATAATLGNNVALARINNDDAAPTLTVAAGPPVTEGDANATSMTFTVNLDRASGQDVVVSYVTDPGTATEDVDYAGVQASLTILAGQTSGSVLVSILGDILDEDEETFELRLLDVVNATTLPGMPAILARILDNAEDTATVGIVPGTIQVLEGNSANATEAVFTIELSRPSAFLVAVDYVSLGGNGVDPAKAVAGNDFTPVSGRLTFLPGVTTQTVAVPILGDTVLENDESFELKLVAASRAGLQTAEATRTALILNDDWPVVTISNERVIEGQDGTTVQMSFTIELASAP